MKWVRRNGLTALVAALAAGSFAGCHTVEGMGRDVEAAGEGVAGTAEETRPYDEQGRQRDDYYRDDSYYR